MTPKLGESAQASAWLAEVGVIQNIKELCAKLNIHTLVDLEVSVKPKIESFVGRTSKSVATQVSECSGRSAFETRSVEPLQSRLLA